MSQVGKGLVIDNNNYCKSELKIFTTTPKYLTEQLNQETTSSTNYHLTNYSQFVLRDGRPFSWEQENLTTTNKKDSKKYGQDYPTDLTKLGRQEVAKQQQYYNNASATLITIDGEIGVKKEKGLLSKQTIFMFDDGLVDGRILATNQEQSVQLGLNQALSAISHRKQTVPIDGLYSILGLLPYGDKVETNYQVKGHEYMKEELNTELKKIMELAINSGYPLESITWLEDGSTNITGFVELKEELKDNIKISPTGEKGDIEIILDFNQFKNNNALKIILPVTDKDTRPIVFESRSDIYNNSKLFLDMVNKEVIEGEELINQYHQQLPIIQQQGQSFNLVYSDK
ncbi:6049_t:CDS:2 [Funneliformis geosporum]|nr:6049_t:CDS:2 [Funneliformis geosporum]